MKSLLLLLAVGLSEFVTLFESIDVECILPHNYERATLVIPDQFSLGYYELGQVYPRVISVRTSSQI